VGRFPAEFNTLALNEWPVGVVDGETQHRIQMASRAPPTRQQIKQKGDRAVAVFMETYGP
jgi:hypothetical protein